MKPRREGDHESIAGSAVPRTFPVDLPGVTSSWLASANGRSPKSIARGRRSVQFLSAEAALVVATMTPELAVAMAQFRPPRGMLPYWSRLAIAELASQGLTYAALMELFMVGRSTVYRAIRGQPRGYIPLSGQRLLTPSQAASVRRAS